MNAPTTEIPYRSQWVWTSNGAGGQPLSMLIGLSCLTLAERWGDDLKASQRSTYRALLGVPVNSHVAQASRVHVLHWFASHGEVSGRSCSRSSLPHATALSLPLSSSPSLVVSLVQQSRSHSVSLSLSLSLTHSLTHSLSLCLSLGLARCLSHFVRSLSHSLSLSFSILVLTQSLTHSLSLSRSHSLSLSLVTQIG